MAEEAKKYLDYDGLKHLVEKLTDKIEASGSGGGDYLPLSGGTIDGDLTVNGTTRLNAAETADLTAEAGLLVIGTDGAVRLATLDALAQTLGFGPAVAFKYNYTGSNTPSIKNTTSRVDDKVIFGFDGAVDVIVNGVRHDNVIAESGDTYAIPGLVTGENDIRIIPRDDGTRVYTLYWQDAYNLAGTYITHIMDWGKWKYVNMDFAFCGPISQTVTGGLKSVCADKWGAFSEVTDFNSCFSYCPELQSVPTGLFDNCPNVTSFYQCFSGCTGLTALPTGLFDNCPNVESFERCFFGCSGLRDCESPYSTIDGTKVHLYEREEWPEHFTDPYSHDSCFLMCTELWDYDDIPSGWK